MEEWKDIKGYEGLYQASNTGKIRSLNYLGYKGIIRELKAGKNKYGYLLVSLYKNKVKKSYRVNRLVYQAFNGDIPNGLQVNHIDEDKENNSIRNLNLMTSKENNNWGTHNERMAKANKGKHRTEEARMKMSRAKKGKHQTKEHIANVSKALINHPKKSKAVAQFSLDGKLIKVWPSASECGRNGFLQGNVSACCRNNFHREGNNVYKGFIWQYV